MQLIPKCKVLTDIVTKFKELIMKSSQNSILLVLTLLLISCTKSKDDSIANSTVLNGCKLSVVKFVGDYLSRVDSLIYNGNNLISHKNYQYYQNRLESKHSEKYEYLNNVIKVSDGVNSLLLTIKDSKLAQISNEIGKVYASYYYSGDKLTYILLGDPKGERDSLAVSFDSNGKNIVEMGNYWFNIKSKVYTFSSHYKYEFDDKLNPYTKSVWYISERFEEFDLSLDYFNTNNIVSITSIVSNAGWGSNGTDYYLYKYNEKNLPIQLIESWNTKNTISYSYQCD